MSKPLNGQSSRQRPALLQLPRGLWPQSLSPKGSSGSGAFGFWGLRFRISGLGFWVFFGCDFFLLVLLVFLWFLGLRFWGVGFWAEGFGFGG